MTTANDTLQSMTDYPRKSSLVPGRWQPLHDGHICMIRVLLAEGQTVIVAIFDTPISKRNPFSFRERVEMFAAAFPREMCIGQIQISKLPWVRDLVYGRDCGWRARRVKLADEIEAVNGTAIRQERKL